VWYDSVSLEERGRIDGVHEGVILDLEVTDSGSILTAGSDGFVRLWDLEGREIQSIPFDGPVNNIEVIDDAHILVTPLDGPGFVLTIDVDELVELARRRLTRGFSESECLRYRLNPCPTLEELQS
jgi:WD40 repeat protein